MAGAAPAKSPRHLRPLFYGIAALVLLVLFLAEAFTSSGRNQSLQTADRLREVAVVQAADLRRYIGSLDAGVRALVPLLPAAPEAGDAALMQSFADYRDGVGASDVFLLTADGETLFCSTHDHGASLLELLPAEFFSGRNEDTAYFALPDGRLGFGLAVPCGAQVDAPAAVVLLFDAKQARSLFDARTFSGAGYLHLFRAADGRFLMRSAAAPSDYDETSLFGALSRVTFADGAGLDQVRALIQGCESGSFRYNTPFDTGRFAYFAPLGVSDWYLASVVPVSVMDSYARQTRQANTLLILKCMAVFLVLIVLVWLDFRGAERALAQSEHRFALAASHYAHVIFEYNASTRRCTILHGQLSRLPGVDSGAEFSTERYLRHIHPDDAPAVKQIQQELFRTQERVSQTIRFRDFDGKDAYRWFCVTLTPIKNGEGVITSALGTLEDVDEEHSRTLLLENRALHDPLTGLLNRQQFVQLVEQTLSAFTDTDSAAMLLLDLDGFKAVNDTFGHAAGDEVLTATANALRELFRESDYIARYGGDEFIVWLNNVSHADLVHKKSDALQRLIGDASRAICAGEDVPISVSAGAVLARAGDGFEALFDAADTALYAAKNSGRGRCVFSGASGGESAPELPGPAPRGVDNRDPLTGVYNKRGFYAEATRLLRLPLAQPLVIAVLDVYRFKVINELFGEAKGDEVLRKLARLMESYLQEGGGVLGRLEADRFALCVARDPDVSMEMFVNRLAADTRDFLPGYELLIYFGVYAVDDPALPPLFMCDRALLALNDVKGDYTRRFAVYNDRIRERILLEQAITNDMTAALDRGEFDVYLQPVFSLSEGRFVSAEALVRWFHPDKGAVLPSVFIPIFEKNGFITRLDRFVWERVCRLLRDWIDDELPVLPVSVNVSAVNLTRSDFTRDITALVEKYGLDPSMLRLELTESAYSKNADEIGRIIAALRAQGFLVYMDDFGSGYSSFSMLNDVPIDLLKIDMRFLQDYEKSPRTKTILTSIVRMAKWMNLSVIAEGVETKAQADFLHSIGCPLIQGYFYSKPLPVSEFTTILLNYGHKADVQRASIEFGDFDMDALMAADPRMEILWNNMLAGMGIYKLTGDHLELLQGNHAYFEMMGLTPETFHAAAPNIIENVAEEDREPLLAACRRATASKAVERVEARRYLPDGRMLYAEVKVRFLGWSGDAAELCFFVSDITEQKQLEETRFLQQFGAASKGLFTLVFDFDESGSAVSVVVHQEGLAIPDTALPFDEAVDWYERRVVEPEFRRAHRAFFTLSTILRRFRSGEERLTFEYPCLFGGHARHWLSATIVPLENSRYICYLIDVTARKQAEAALEKARSLERLEQNRATALQLQQSVLRGIPGGIASFRLENGRWICTYANDTVYLMFGIDLAAVNPALALTAAGLPDDIWTTDTDAATDGGVHTHTFRRTKPGGDAVWIRTSATAVADGGHALTNYVMFTDVTENVLEQMDRSAYIERLQLLEEAAKSLYFDINVPERRMEYTRRKPDGGIEKITTDDYPAALDACALVHPDDKPLFRRTVASLLAAPCSGHVEYRARYSADGLFHWFRVFYMSLAHDGVVYRAVGRMDDIEHEKRAEYLAECDPVSGLYNRRAFEEKFEQYMGRADADAACALLVIDLDDFSAVTEAGGGDERARALVEDFSALLSHAVGSSAIAGYFGGDEFCVFLGGSVTDGAERAANRIIHDFAATTSAKYGRAYTCSIGLSFCGSNGLPNYLLMYREAVSALYRAKASGKNRCAAYRSTTAGDTDAAPLDGTPMDNALPDAELLSDSAAAAPARMGLAAYILDRLSRAADVRACVREVLDLVGNQLNVSRVYIFEDAPDGTFCRNTFEWCNAEVSPQIANLQQVSYETLGDYYANFSEHDIFYCPDVSTLPDNLRRLLEPQGIRAMLQCAFRKNGKHCGYMGFDECNCCWVWTKKQVEILSFIARIIGAYLFAGQP